MNSWPTLRTDRIIIKVPELKDKDIFFGYRVLPEVCLYQFWKPNNIHEVEAFLKNNLETIPNTQNTWLQLGIFLHNGTLIGDIGLHFLEDGFQMEIGYTLAPEHQGQGYAFEAVKMVLDYLFGQLEKHRVTASVDPENIRSRRLLEKLGFRREGHFIQSVLIRGEWCDDEVYAMLKEEWKSMR